MSNDDILGKGITGNNNTQRRDILGAAADEAVSGALNTSADRGWLPAPYNIIVAPVNAGGGQTAQGNDYERSLEQYMARAARVDQNEEAKQIRQAWSTPPRVSIENGMLQLSGTKAFLQSDTAKQLRAVFKEMKGQTYNTEALNRQIEAWNTDLQKMSESYMTNLDNYNKINYTTLQSARGPQPGMISFNEYMMLMNSARVGQDPDAASSNKLIFVGYEWDDKGNKTPVYKTAAEFFEEFNSTPDSKKRDAYRDLITQANQGDPAAMSKLFYLRGGSEGGPANVTYSAGERWNDFLRTAWENTVIGLAEAADFVTTYVPIINLPRLAGRVGQAINAQDASKFFASDFIREGIDNFEDVVGWENAYFSQLTPGSTQLAALSGGAIGTVLGMAYSIWAGSVGNAALMSAVNRAFTAAENYALGTGKFVEYTGTYSSTTGKLQKVVVMDGARVAGEIPRVVDPVVGGARGSVVIPKFIFDKWPGLAEGMAKVGLELQLATGIGGAGSAANLAGRAGDTAGELRWAFSGPTQNLAARWTEGGRILLDAESLAKLRSQANALRMAANLYALGNESAIRHVDQYFQKENRGEDPGNMAEYVAGGVARDIILGGSMIAGGAIVSHIANLSRSSNIPARVVWEGGYTSSLNSQSGFYSMPKMLGTGGATIDTDIANTVNSIATVNGEKIFFSPVEGITPTVIPGTEGGGAFGAVSTLENAIGKTTIEPVVGGFAVVTETTNLDTNNKITTTKFFSDLDEANNYVAAKSVPTVNPSTLMNSDLAATGNIVPFNVGGRSALKLLPNGVSRARIQPDITYLTPAEYADEVTPIVEMMSPELRAAYEKAMVVEDTDSLSQQIYAKDAPLLDAPRLFVPRTEAEAIELAQSVARARAVAAANPTSSPIMPVRTEPDDIEIVKRRRMVTERTFISGPMAREYNNDFAPTGAPARARLAPAEYYVPFEVKYIPRDEGERIEARIPAEWQHGWFVERIRAYRDQIADLILSDPELRNACLVKMYDEWVGVNNDMGVQVDIPYEEWVDTDITLYRWSGGKNHGDNKVLSYSFYPGGYPQFGRNSDSITIIPRETTGMGDWFNEEGSEQEVFVPTEVVTGKQKLDTELKERQKSAITKAGKKAPDVSDIKTYSEVMTNDILNHGFSDDFTRGDVYKALITNRIKVYSNTPIEDGALVTPVQSEVELPDGGELYSKEVNLSDVAWKDASKGIFASDTIYPTLFDWAKANPSATVGEAPSATAVETAKSRKTIEVKQRTPRNIVVTEYGLPKRWFSDKDEALDFKEEKAGRSIYEIDPDATILDRPPVTMDNIYLPGVRGSMGVTAAMDPVDFKYTPNTSDAVERFNGLMAGMPTLVDSPTDYTQGIVDIAAQVKAVHDEIAKAIDLDAVYEDYARQIAEGVEQPTVPDDVKETLKPLTDMLTALGRYFDPSGKSLTQEFYLPTGAPSKKLATIEDALLHPEKAVDPDQVLDGSFDDILIDPLRVGDEGFWEKRTGELFRNEDGEFTMAKAGTLEENLMAYTVSALTRGQNRLLVTANDEVALSKADRNRNTITTKQALKGLKSADKNRARIRAAQLKAARSYDRAMKKEKMGKLVEDYSDEATINAIEEAYAARNFVKELDYTRRTNKDAKTLGYRQTLTINPIKGSALRFGTETGIKGIANDIRAASHITVTGTKWVRRDDEYVNVGFGMSEGQKDEYEFTRIEPAVNLGDSATLMFSPDRAARKLFENIQSELAEYTTTGGWGLTNILNKYACKNFPLVTNPKKSINKLTKQIASDFEAYNGTEAFNVAVLSRLSTWIKNSAANNINSAIQMADITNLDDRTIRAIDQIMTKANVGVAVYQGKIVSALQQLAYQATLAFNFSPMVGNILSEPERAIDFYGYKVFARAMKKMANPKEVSRVKKIVGDLPSRFADDRDLVGLAEKAKTVVGRAAEVYTNVSMSPLQKSEEFKNLLFWLCAEENAKLMYPNDKSAQLQNTLRTFNDTAIAGGPGTTPGVANSDLGRAVFILKTFSLRNWDDFIEMVEQIGRSRSGSYKWDRTRRGQDTGGQGGYSSTAGKKFDWKKAGRFMGGTLLRRYLLWLIVLGPLGRSIWDALGGDPTGLTENYSRGLYDDEGTDAYEGMTPIDNIINAIPTGFIFGTLKDFYFAARRAGVETGNFFGGVDITKDPRLQKDLRQHLPVGTVTNRIGDMLELLDRGYSYNSYGNKTYAAPENIGDVIKGFMLGKSATSNAQAYNKYRYGSVNIWGDLFEGDWMDFAMSANPFADNLGLVKFDSTRKDYNGVFHGSYNDVPTMQAAIADLRKRRADIIDEYNKDLEKFTGEFQGLNDTQKKALAEKRKEAKIKTFTEDIQRLVDEYQKAGNALSDKQINTMMYLFDFNEGDDDTYDSQAARERYVEAGLPDFDPINQTATRNDEGETTEQNYFQRSLVYQNAVQGRYGIPRDAAKAVDSALADFKSTYKAYKKRVSDLNDKAYSAAKGSAERKKYQAEVEKIQEQYLDQLYSALTPVVQKYGTEVLSSNDVIESLQPYMSSMIPYSSIRKYGLTFSSGNDIVWGQLADWVKNRWGASAPITGSDPEITQGLKTIKSLRNQGKISQAKSQARLLLERIARGSLSARNNDVIELRRILND